MSLFGLYTDLDSQIKSPVHVRLLFVTGLIHLDSKTDEDMSPQFNRYSASLPLQPRSMSSNAPQTHVQHVTTSNPQRDGKHNLYLRSTSVATLCYSNTPIPYLKLLFAMTPRVLGGSGIARWLRGRSTPPNDAMDERVFDPGACDQAAHRLVPLMRQHQVDACQAAAC